MSQEWYYNGDGQRTPRVSLPYYMGRPAANWQEEEEHIASSRGRAGPTHEGREPQSQGAELLLSYKAQVKTLRTVIGALLLLTAVLILALIALIIFFLGDHAACEVDSFPVASKAKDGPDCSVAFDDEWQSWPTCTIDKKGEVEETGTVKVLTGMTIKEQGKRGKHVNLSFIATSTRTKKIYPGRTRN